MPTSLSSSFASAAAGGNLENGVRRDGSGNSEWSRNRPNGATQTFRRTSQANTQSRDNLQSVQGSTSAGAYMPPHANQPSATGNGASLNTRYGKDQMLAIYRSQKEGGVLDRHLEQLFQGPWDYAARNGSIQAKDNKEQPGPEVCWNPSSDGEPFGLSYMSDAEKQLFTTSVNSPVKMTQNKDGSTGGSGARKPSISNHHGAPYGVGSGTGTRPSVRRRDTSDSFTNGPLSPIGNKTFFGNEPSTNTPPLRRRTTDRLDDDPKSETKDPEPRPEPEIDTQTPFTSLRRLATGPMSAGLNGPSSSPWSAAPGGPRSAFESMGGFGSFAVGNSPAGQDTEKRPGFGSARGGSRFKDLLNKTSTEDMSQTVKEKASFGVLGKLPEEEDGGQSRLRDVFKTRPNRSETNPYDEGVPRSGSAALSQDEQGIEQMGFSSFQPGAAQTDIHGTPHGRRNNDPMSPTNTNPYQSPAGGRAEDDDGYEYNAQLSGHPSFGAGRRDVFSGSHERNQPSGFGPPRPGLGGLGGAAAAPWGASGFGTGTPNRERAPASSAFGDTIFSPIGGDIQSPTNAGLGSAFFGSGSIGSAGRPSRLGALLPPAMQEQMRPENRNDAFDNLNEGRDPFDGARRQDSFRNLFDDARSIEGNFSPQPGVGSQSSVGAPGAAQRSSVGPEQSSGHGPSRSSESSGSNVLPAAQQRQMVMPDRMRWIYRDPQGNVQGPWSGLEMHDWFKAGFFTAELQVKKLEDGEYEPLAQLVRRIGNSREPFLVPQIGVPHGPPAANQGNHWATNIGGAQPPFANSFPSFGTTLTAEQQNALERRKQEEQYLMARQKEHLAQQQMYMKQIQMQHGSGLHGLQHHSSAHSLHSQPSFGSIASPGGYQSSSMQAPIQPPQPMPNFGAAPGSGPQQPGREEELPGMVDRMNLNQRGGMPFGVSPIGTQPPTMGQGQGTFQERSRLGGDGLQADTHAHEEAFLGQDGRNERLEEFNDLREQFDHEQDELSIPQPIGAPRSSEEPTISTKQAVPSIQQAGVARLGTSEDRESLSLTQQVQRTAAAHEKAAADENMPILPPPMSISPLPAPAAQRNRQHVADALAAGSRSPTQTPVAETPTSTSIAPWADKTVDMPKGPSLREIQEAEAKRAAEQEELLAAARRAQVEQERMAAAALPPPAPGLPLTSTWASSASPVSPAPGTSVWAKPGAKPVATGNSAPKKTLAQIQKEEEARKQRAVAQATAQVQAQAASYNQPANVTGKRYAELASKNAPPTPPAVGGAWTTVGSGGGKAKPPATVVATPNATPRTVSTGTVVPPAAATATTRPPLQTTRTTSVNSQSKAMDEFAKWTKVQLGNGLNSGINVDNFVQNLLMLPPEIEIIRDSVYASSQTLHGGRFAEEFVRRRKLADKGIVEPSSESGSPGPAVDAKAGAGGWSEVAKKGPVAKEESNSAAFKVVAKKKGRK